MSHRLHIIDGLSKMFVPGTILWRTLSFHNKVPKNEDVILTKTEQGTWVGRLQVEEYREENCWEPIVIGNQSITGVRFQGIVIFLNDLPPPDWTHLLVDRVSYAMDSPGINVPGSAIFAKVADPLQMDDYLNFRHNIATIYDKDKPFEDIVKECLEIWPEGHKKGDRRLLYQRIYNDREYIYNYCHLVIKPN